MTPASGLTTHQMTPIGNEGRATGRAEVAVAPGAFSNGDPEKGPPSLVGLPHGRALQREYQPCSLLGTSLPS